MRLTVFGVLFFLAALVAVSFFQSRTVRADDLVARGRYLVNDAGKCTDCHGVNLRGMNLDFMKPGMPVAYRSANIAGLKHLSTAAAVSFLRTGLLPNGKQAAPPMPQYRFNSSDAQAIVAYLKSLK